MESNSNGALVMECFKLLTRYLRSPPAPGEICDGVVHKALTIYRTLSTFARCTESIGTVRSQKNGSQLFTKCQNVTKDLSELSQYLSQMTRTSWECPKHLLETCTGILVEMLRHSAPALSQQILRILVLYCSKEFIDIMVDTGAVIDILRYIVVGNKLTQELALEIFLTLILGSDDQCAQILRTHIGAYLPALLTG